MFPSVIFLDKPFAIGMPHIWIREYFYGVGLRFIDFPLPPWKESILTSPCDTELPGYLEEIDWEELSRHTVARLIGMYGYKESVELNILIQHFKKYAKKLEQIFISNEIKYIVIFGNYRVETKLAALFSEIYDAQLICIESFFLSEAFYLEHGSTQIANHHEFINRWQFLKNFKPKQGEIEKLDIMMKSRESNGLLNGYIDNPDFNLSNSALDKKLSKCEGKIALLLGQVAHDAVIVNDLPGFKDLNDFLVSAIESFLQTCSPRDIIICRLHPLEARYGDKTAEYLNDKFLGNNNVVILSDQDYNTYKLMSVADFGIVANSQTGLEMAYRGKPTLICGRPYYADVPCFYQATDSATLQTQIKHLLNIKKGEDKNTHILKQYLSALVFHHLCMKSKDAVFKRLSAIIPDKQSIGSKTLKYIRKTRNYLYKVLSTRVTFQKHGILPDGSMGIYDIELPVIGDNSSYVVFGVGTISHVLADNIKLNIHFCSDVASDLRLGIQGREVLPFSEEVIRSSNYILFTSPSEKTKQLISSLKINVNDGYFYQLTKKEQNATLKVTFQKIHY